jgi:hypothetical protein
MARPTVSLLAASLHRSKLLNFPTIEKLRGTDEPKSKMTRLDEKIDALDKETQRLSA